jgi:AhpC/TSA antioxidant enzyme
MAVRDHLADLHPAKVVLITFSEQHRLHAYKELLRLPFEVLSDADRVFYRAFGLGQASTFRLYRPKTLRMYARLLRKGRRIQRPVEDTHQLGGDFLIDPQGRIAWQYHSAGPDDRPDVSVLVEQLRLLS